MSRIISRIAIAAALAFVVALSAAAAHAAALRTFVSGFGSDSNTSANCAHAAPCRTFAVAVTVTAPGGEIEALDPSGYGPITITGPLTLVGVPGAAINAPAGGNGITINAGPSDNVTLIGLLIDGGNVGSAGIAFNSGASLTVENSIVLKNAGSGLAFRPTGTTTKTLAVSDSYFSDNASNGLDIEPKGSGAVTAAIDRTGFYNNANQGLFVYGANGTGVINVAVTDSVAANNNSYNGDTGFDVESGQSVANLSLTHCLAVGNAIGVSAGSSNATLWLAQSTVTGNGLGYNVGSGGVIKTYSDNYLAAGNGGNSGSLTTVGKQ